MAAFGTFAWMRAEEMAFEIVKKDEVDSLPPRNNEQKFGCRQRDVWNTLQDGGIA